MKPQHLTAVSWLAATTEARVSGMAKKSKELFFLPSDESNDHRNIERTLSEYPQLALLLKREPLKPMPKKVESQIDIGSPGSITLVFQALLPFILFSTPAALSLGNLKQFHLTIHGGTNVTQSPSIDYLRLVLFPMLALVGLPRIHCHVTKRGWITGRSEVGSVTFGITPVTPGWSLPAFELGDRGKIKSLQAMILAPRWSQTHFQRLLREAVDGSRQLKDLPLTIDFEESGHPRRIYLLLVATAESGVKLGRDWLFGSDGNFRGPSRARNSKSAKAPSDGSVEDVEKTVSKVVNDLCSELKHGGCVDEHMRDQLIVFQALARGKSFVDGGKREGELVGPSLHTRTAQWVAEEIIGATFDGHGGCEGVNFVVGGRYRDRRETAQTTIDLGRRFEELNIGSPSR